jgi:hypothetical protein
LNKLDVERMRRREKKKKKNMRRRGLEELFRSDEGKKSGWSGAGLGLLAMELGWA